MIKWLSWIVVVTFNGEIFNLFVSLFYVELMIVLVLWIGVLVSWRVLALPILVLQCEYSDAELDKFNEFSWLLGGPLCVSVWRYGKKRGIMVFMVNAYTTEFSDVNNLLKFA